LTIADRSGYATAVVARRNSAVERYYDETWADYRCLWLNRRNLAFHFGYYDAPEIRRHAEALQNTNRQLARRAAVRPGSRVLDAGCGVGGSSRWLARQTGATAVGITPVHSQVTMARQLAAAEANAGRALFLPGDYTAVPFRAGTFDAVWALESLCHADDKAAFYREAARVLRPGGRLVVAEYMRVARPLRAGGERLVRAWLDGWAIPDLDMPAEHRAHAVQAGLADAEVEDYTACVRPSLRRLFRIARVSYPFALTARVLRMRSAVQHGNVRAALRQYEALEQGLWVYGILSATKPG
jgi:cyclopropane fatty-acyl-phospholipid synthase-like methyltransferase